MPGGPKPGSRAFLEEIADSALIREVHVYGPALSLGDEKPGAAQHVGLGTQLLEAAQRIASEAGFQRLSVIAATGTPCLLRRPRLLLSVSCICTKTASPLHFKNPSSQEAYSC